MKHPSHRQPILSMSNCPSKKLFLQNYPSYRRFRVHVSFVSVFSNLVSIFQNFKFSDLLLKACFLNLVRRDRVENFFCTYIQILRKIFDKNILVGSMKNYFFARYGYNL